mmetsp:Transcript_24268/g.28261  ORF Transcript_24268/g.28261 Transcript_24268/m.28261 type:complete len:82 (+) Transcript_24268:248-493(+)
MVEESLLETATAVINKSWQTILCLYFEPKVIAIAALTYAHELNNNCVGMNESKLGLGWRKYFGEINEEEINEVTKYLKELN